MGFMDEIADMVIRTQGATPRAIYSINRLHVRLTAATPSPYREGTLPIDPSTVLLPLMEVNRRRRCRFPVAAAAMLYEKDRLIAWSIGLNECPPHPLLSHEKEEETRTPRRGGRPTRPA